MSDKKYASRQTLKNRTNLLFNNWDHFLELYFLSFMRYEQGKKDKKKKI